MTDGSRLDTGRIRAGVVSKQTEWRTWKTYQGTNNEVFNAESYATGEVLCIALRGGRTGWGSGSQTAATR